MAKGAGSSSAKATRTWRRENIKPPAWQVEADARRYALLAEAAAAPLPERPVEEQPQQQPEDGDVQMDIQRGRKGKKKQAAAEMEDDDDVEMLQAQQTGRKGRSGKGKLSGGVQKKRRAGKLFLIGLKNQFHKGKKRRGSSN